MTLKNKNIFRFVLTLLAIILCASGISEAQSSLCNFDNYIRNNFNSVSISEAKIKNYLSITSLQRYLTHGNIYKIPVVVHVIHDGGIENISDVQIQSQIDVLNQDYRRIVGTNGYGNGADTEIEFCLAKITPDGDCTNGIVRIKSPLAYHESYQREQLSLLSSWDPNKYLNIYIVKSMAGSVLGYASFPGGPINQDGMVVIHNAFGTIGTAQFPFNLGRTCSHEIGHWFGLYHTFNGGCGIDTCSDGDQVCDTPPVINPNFNCSVTNTCSNDFPDLPDQIENYMDYTDDVCKNMFTAGQRDRMQATLNIFRNDIWAPSNLTATGCDSNYISPMCNVVANFTANGTDVCINNTVTFLNQTLNNPTSFYWVFPGGSPAIDTSLNPIITYDTLGDFDVTLIATGQFGSDTLVMNNFIHVILPSIGQAIPFDETFESSTFPSNGITIENSDNGVTWERDSVAICFEGMGSAKINNLVNVNYGQSDALVLPKFDLTSTSDIPYLKFRWAYARSDANYSDELLVLVSTDCGLTFSQIFYKTGFALTTGPTQTVPYIPDSTTVWKKANINLNPYRQFNNVILKIVNVTDGGNNLYIDSLHVGSMIPTGTDFSAENKIQSSIVYPNPFNSEIQIKFSENESKEIELVLFDLYGRILDQTIAKIPESKIIIWKPILKDNKVLILQIKSEHSILSTKVIYSK